MKGLDREVNLIKLGTLDLAREEVRTRHMGKLNSGSFEKQIDY